MKLSKKQLDIKSGVEKEWIITNGIGGYASSTVLGVNTRRYHGLLVAPLKPPAMRNLILSKLDESIYIEDEKYDLYTNMCENYISEGYKYLDSFENIMKSKENNINSELDKSLAVDGFAMIEDLLAQNLAEHMTYQLVDKSRPRFIVKMYNNRGK